MTPMPGCRGIRTLPVFLTCPMMSSGSARRSSLKRFSVVSNFGPDPIFISVAQFSSFSQIPVKRVSRQTALMAIVCHAVKFSIITKDNNADDRSKKLLLIGVHRLVDVVYVANTVMFGLRVLFGGLFYRIALLPFPLIILACVLGAYAGSSRVFDSTISSRCL